MTPLGFGAVPLYLQLLDGSSLIPTGHKIYTTCIMFSFADIQLCV